MKTTRRKDKLKEFLDGQEQVDQLLPSTHITQAFYFDDILESDSLEPQLCPIINEKLTYMFYGRPSYRARQERSSSLQFDWPIVFILDTNKLQPMRRIFPFDSGAFSYGLYKEYFHDKSQMGDFELDPTFDSIRKLVRAFYTTNESYMDGSFLSNYPPLLREFEVDGLREMAKCPGNPEMDRTRDERSTSIEIQIDRNLPLKDSLLAIILPALYLDQTETRDAIKSWGIDNVKTYKVIQNSNPEMLVGQIYELVISVYKEIGALENG